VFFPTYYYPTVAICGAGYPNQAQVLNPYQVATIGNYGTGIGWYGRGTMRGLLEPIDSAYYLVTSNYGQPSEVLFRLDGVLPSNLGNYVNQYIEVTGNVFKASANGGRIQVDPLNVRALGTGTLGSYLPGQAYLPG